MKYLVLFACLLASGPVVGQAPAGAASGAAPLALPDTAAAIHRLFASRRQRLVGVLLGTVAAEVAGQVVVANTVQSGGLLDSRAIDQFFTALLVVPVVAGEVLFFVSYNEKHEQRALADFEAHRLSRHLTRKLKARYFR